MRDGHSGDAVPRGSADEAGSGFRHASAPSHRPQIRSLTGLRFLASFSVAFGHTVPVVMILGLDPHALTAIGMPLFFTLSGFIIHYTYCAPFASGWRRATAEFAAARFSRIYPLYIALLAIMLAISPMGARLMRSDGIPILGAYLLGVTTWLPLSIDGKLLAEWHYGISWSISTEFFFYVCYAVFLYRIGSIRDLRWAVVGLLSTVLGAAAVICAILVTKDQWEPLALAAFPALGPRLGDFQNSFFRWALYFSPYGQLPGFICGAFTCQIFLLIRRAGLEKRIGANMLAWASAAGIVLTWIEFQWLGADGHWLRGNTAADVFVGLHMNMLFVPFCCTLMLALALRPTMIGAALSTSAAVFLGEISYSTYLGHPLAQGVVARLFWRVPEVPRLIVTMIAIVVLATALFVVIEVPAKRFLRRAWRSLGRPAPQPVRSAAE